MTVRHLFSLVFFFGFTTSLLSQSKFDQPLILNAVDTVSEASQYVIRKEDGSLGVIFGNSSSLVQAPKPLDYEPEWEDFKVGYQPGTYYKHNERVYLDGLLRNTTGSFSSGDDIAYLPEGYRPRNRITLGAFQSLDLVRINIDPNGLIWIVNSSATSDFLSLDGLSFRRDDHVEVGDIAEGGVVFYVADPPADLDGDGDLDEGMAVALFDQSSGFTWGCVGTEITGADGEAIGTGYQNTIDIIAGCPEVNIAARLCADLDLYGADDWFLPSRFEFAEVTTSVGQLATGENYNLANFASFQQTYNTSTESSSSPADRYIQLSNLGLSPVHALKDFTNRVRAVRVFGGVD